MLSTPLVLLPIKIATADGLTALLVPQFSTLPLLRSARFTNPCDGQTTATLHLVTGSRARASDNISRPKIVLHGLTPVPRGTAHIRVSLAIDLEGVGVLTAEQHLPDDSVVFSKVVKLPAIGKISPDAYTRHVDESEGADEPTVMLGQETPVLPA